MNATRDCILSDAKAGFYQQRARILFEKALDATIQPQAWILTTCGMQCLAVEHMFTHTPIRIKYPPGVCIYCGMPAGTKDHIQPRTITGDARRPLVALVPACAECNSRIGDRCGHNVAERRKYAQDGLRRKYRSVLDAPAWTPSQLAEFGPGLRQHLVGSGRKREVILSRVGWPEDPFYDLRAFQQSGIDDPVALGLCNNPLEPTPESAADRRTAPKETQA